MALHGRASCAGMLVAGHGRPALPSSTAVRINVEGTPDSIVVSIRIIRRCNHGYCSVRALDCMDNRRGELDEVVGGATAWVLRKRNEVGASIRDAAELVTWNAVDE